jgi:hypothetical protein
MKLPLSRFAASPSLYALREGDDAFAARRLLLGIPGFGPRQFHGLRVARSAMNN